ncbi:MAG: succinate dehydrogenase assembly factor 4 [Pseudomonadota bacterium]
MTDAPKDIKPAADSVSDAGSQAPSPSPTTQAEIPAGRADGGKQPESGGPKGPEPTRYGDWEKGGRCIDF